jgi:hypothetical protein
MNSNSEQVIILFKQGNSPADIGDLLSLDIADVLLILNSAGMLTKKKVEASARAREFKERNNNQPIICDDKERENYSNSCDNDSDIDTNTNSDISIEEEVAQMYRKYHKRIAKNLITIATSSPDEIVPAGVIAKVGMYLNEEVTGRNDARARRQNQSMLLNVAEMLAHAKLAGERLNKILESSDTKQIPNNIIEVNSAAMI